jgi:phosphinothricin acetyltransferase
MSDSFTLRPAAADDFAAIAAITNHYIETTAIHFGYQPVTADELRATWAAAQPRYPWRVAVAVAAGAVAVVGYAKAGEWRSRAAYQWTAELGLYVDPAWHRRGIGRALYVDVIDAAAAAGFRSVIGGITLPNPASVELHRVLGFAHVGTFRDAGYKLGAWHDVGFYQRRLGTDDSATRSAGTTRTPS